MAPESWINCYVFVVQTADFLILWNQITLFGLLWYLYDVRRSKSRGQSPAYSETHWYITLQELQICRPAGLSKEGPIAEQTQEP